MIRKLFLLALGFAIFGCNKSNDLKNDNIEVLSVENSECKGNERAMTDGNDELLIVRSSGVNIYSIRHTNVMFNCCLPAGLTVEVACQNDTIYYTEKEKILGECRCICPYDLWSEIGNLEEGEYVLCLIKEAIKLGTIALYFKNNMNEEILVSELKDYPYL